MVSPEHIDEQKPEDQQALSPAVEQQVPAVVEKKRPWLKPLMRVAGIVLPLVCNFAVVWVIFVISAQSQPIDSQSQQTDWSFLPQFLLPLGVLLLGAVSALLFRSWWAILVVPIAFALGGLLAFYLIPLVISPNPLEIGDVGLGVFLWAIIGPICALFGALIGSTIIKRADKPLLTKMPKDF